MYFRRVENEFIKFDTVMQSVHAHYKSFTYKSMLLPQLDQLIIKSAKNCGTSLDFIILQKESIESVLTP